MGGRIRNKTLVFGAVVIFLFTVLSPVYASFSFDKSIEIESIVINIDENENQFDRDSYIERHILLEDDEHPRHCYPTSKPIRSSTTIDGEDWDIVVPDDYPTIHEAIYNAKIGYRIYVRSGCYNECIRINKASLIMRGEDRNNTIINGDGYGDVISVIKDADGVIISGFTIQNSSTDFTGLTLFSDFNIVENNIIKNNNNAINLYLSNGNQIFNNQIFNNTDGLRLRRSHANNITANSITNNQENGIKFEYSSFGSNIEYNEISHHSHCGIYIDNSSLGNVFTSSTISNNEYGVKCIGVSDGNTFHNNVFVDN